ncbi:F0F1 ATP synthase subunit B [Candidatus Halocynthiibacter alkanivorans]|uniref:F0F1 ATP synthase subunit B n=1 Tax=Candidatus Halocynthiibacter alkanivorans TaxID=2267619 RepID=UPI000DF1A540|nr:F0F1 ATP synthase subunit B [Candidatus Halocynthiibacter alkanivorans]
MKKLIVLAILTATPAAAAEGSFFALTNTDFVVILAFSLFVGLLLKFGVPAMIAKLLDERAEGIRSDLEEAKALREEAQIVLASFERKQREVQDQADRIVEQAKADAEKAAVEAKAELKASIARRLAAAEDQISSAQASAVKEVRDTAVTVAVGAARDIIAKQMTAADGNKLIDASIETVGAKLH